MYEPDPSPQAAVLAVINEVPGTFFRLSAIAGTLFADLGVTGPERGAMRHLFIEGEATAPELAARKHVSRQAMQAALDGVVAKGFSRAGATPRHTRSQLYSLTPGGVAVCVEMQRRELSAIRDYMGDIVAADFAAAAEALRKINATIDRRLASAR